MGPQAWQQQQHETVLVRLQNSVRLEQQEILLGLLPTEELRSKSGKRLCFARLTVLKIRVRW